MQETTLGEVIFAKIQAGPVFVRVQIQENSLRNYFSACLPNSWGNSWRREYMPHLYSHPRQYSKKDAGELFMSWFRVRGIFLLRFSWNALEKCPSNVF